MNSRTMRLLKFGIVASNCSCVTVFRLSLVVPVAAGVLLVAALVAAVLAYSLIRGGTATAAGPARA